MDLESRTTWSNGNGWSACTARSRQEASRPGWVSCEALRLWCGTYGNESLTNTIAAFRLAACEKRVTSAGLTTSILFFSHITNGQRGRVSKLSGDTRSGLLIGGCVVKAQLMDSCSHWQCPRACNARNETYFFSHTLSARSAPQAGQRGIA